VLTNKIEGSIGKKLHEIKRERDNVVYWKTNGKINFDLQYGNQEIVAEREVGKWALRAW